MTRRKTIDPRRIALLDRQDKLRADFERSYSRMKRAFHRMEKARAALARLARQLAKIDAEGNGAGRAAP
jgi:hypothetical protein